MASELKCLRGIVAINLLIMVPTHYNNVIVTRLGGPEVLQVVENKLRLPLAGEVRIKVLASSVSQPDITARAGKALYSGTPLGQKVPFVPGYSVVGDIDALGEGVDGPAGGERVGALTVTGGYSEYLYWRSDRLIPVPASLNPIEAVTIILNYLVAYQVLHRSARVKPGEKTLIIGASGGIGSALLQIGKLAGLDLYGIASTHKHWILKEYGAVAIDYHNQDFIRTMKALEPGGLDAVLSGMTRLDYIEGGLSILRKGGRLVSFGEPSSLSTLLRILLIILKANLSPNGKSFKLYGTSTYFLFDRQPYLDDWKSLFALLEQGRISPVIADTLPLHEAGRAHALLESGQVVGNLVLVAPELL